MRLARDFPSTEVYPGHCGTNGNKGGAKTRLSPTALLLVCGLAAATAVLVLSQDQLQVGYAVIQPAAGSSAPTGSALFSLRNGQGILISEAGVAAVATLRRGRVFVDQAGTRTGVALANPSQDAVTVRLTLRDTGGDVLREPVSLMLAPEAHSAQFVDQFFSDLPGDFRGSLTFEAEENRRVAAVTLRQGSNSRREPLFATLPVVDLDQAAPVLQGGVPASVIFPHLGAGGIISTQIILINRTDQPVRGEIRLVASSGAPLQVELDGQPGSTFSYSLDGSGVMQATVTNSVSTVQGYAVVTADTGVLPAGTAIFQFRDAGGFVVSEAGVGAAPATTRARIFVDTVGTQTGVAVAGPGNAAGSIDFELLDRNGISIGTVSRPIPAGGHFSLFVDALFPGLPPGFTGQLEIRSQDPVFPITLKLTTNARNELILTTLPIADLDRPAPEGLVVFPQVGFGLGFSTRLILINVDQNSVSSGSLTFRNSDGERLLVPLAGETSDRFDYEVVAGGAAQLRPGNRASIAEVLLNPEGSSEVAVNVGSELILRPVVVDTEGLFRDDFPLTLETLDLEVASLDEQGRLTGNREGFSTLTVTSGEFLAVATINVVSVTSGSSSFEVTGIARDRASRLYLASTDQHSIFLAPSLEAAAELFAGVRGQPGFRDDQRFSARFDTPTFLAFDQGRGFLYVSDSANHAVRRIEPGPAGSVATLAGVGSPGFSDGAALQARFNDPRGIGLDAQGNLWVADSGNHVIRRINLSEGTVETIAGQAGVSGTADGVGTDARFSSPAGLALEGEPLAELLERELSGEPPPPIRFIVADRGSGLIRRVFEDGRVETVAGIRGTGGAPAPAFSGPTGVAVSDPVGVAVDSLGTIFVSRPSASALSAILPNGEVVDAAQPGTFFRPQGIAITRQGELVVAEPESTARRLVYGNPRIESIEPSVVRNDGGQEVTISGSNFAPESVLIVAGVQIESARVENTREITFTAPLLPSGRTTVTVQNRGGIAQAELFVDAVGLDQLAAGHITTVAGGSTFSGDGRDAREAVFSLPQGLAVESNGGILISDTFNHRVRRIDPLSGIITSVAGTGVMSFSGDGQLANTAGLATPGGIAVDSSGRIYIADSINNRIRRVDPVSGLISTVAGNNIPRFPPGDGGPASEAFLSLPTGVALDAADNLYIADRGNGRIRRVDAVDQTITTVAGNGQFGFGGDGVPADETSLNLPERVTFNSAGDLFIADSFNHRVRRVDAETGTISTVAGNGVPSFSGDGGPATDASLNFPTGLRFDGDENLFIADRANNRIRRVDALTGRISTVAGTGSPVPDGDGGPAEEAAISNPTAVAIDAADNLLVTDSGGGSVRQIDALTSFIDTIAGTGFASLSGDGGPATAAALVSPFDVALSPEQDAAFIAETGVNRIRKLDFETGLIDTVAGTGLFGNSPEDGVATETALGVPAGVAVDSTGNLFIAERASHRIRRVDSRSGMITSVAGIGVGGFSGDGGPATEAQINGPARIALDQAGNLYFSESLGHRIRRIDAQSGVIETIAGNGIGQFSGDGGPASEASLFGPTALLFDSEGGLLVADSSNGRVRRIDLSSGVIDTIAGGGNVTVEGGSIPALSAAISSPEGLALDSNGNVYVSAHLDHRVLRLDARNGTIRSVVGTGEGGFSGDNQAASSAALAFPIGIAVDQQDNLYIVDFLNGRLRAVRAPLP